MVRTETPRWPPRARVLTPPIGDCATADQGAVLGDGHKIEFSGSVAFSNTVAWGYDLALSGTTIPAMIEVGGAARNQVIDVGTANFATASLAGGLMRVSTNGAAAVGKNGFTTFTNERETALNAGNGSVKMHTGNDRTNAGFIKIYIDTTAYWIPIWSTIS